MYDQSLESVSELQMTKQCWNVNVFCELKKKIVIKITMCLWWTGDLSWVSPTSHPIIAEDRSELKVITNDLN